MPETDDENLYKRGAIWCGRVRIGGKEYRKSLRTRSKAEARKRRDRWIETLNGEGGATYMEAVARFGLEFLPSSVKPGTADRYRVSLIALDRQFRDKLVSEINHGTIAAFVSARKKQRVSNATIKRDLTALSRLLSCCVAWGFRTDNPAKFYDRTLIREQREPIQPPSDEDIEKVIAVAPVNVANLVRFLRHTGCRKQEALGLEWPAVDLKNKQITFLKTKTSRPRIIGLNESVLGTLQGTPRHPESKVVFWHGEGERYAFLNSQFQDLLRKAKVKFRLHDLRHKFAIEWLRSGGDIYKLSKYLGHTSVTTTEMYLRWLRQEAESAEGTESGTHNPVSSSTEDHHYAK